MALFRKRRAFTQLVTYLSWDPRKQHLGKAATEWRFLEPHPLTQVQQQIALVAFQYGRILTIHKETRTELFKRVGLYALKLVLTGECDFQVWRLRTGGTEVPVWPWDAVSPSEMGKATQYVATLQEGGGPGGATYHLKLGFGKEKLYVPSSAIIPLVGLCLELDSEDRKRMGRVLIAMNEYAGGPDGFSKVRSELPALQAAMPVLTE